MSDASTRRRAIIGVIVLLVVAGGFLIRRGEGASPSGDAPEARGRSSGRGERAHGGRTDPSVLRVARPYGSPGESHANLELSLRVLEAGAEGHTRPSEGATLVIDDEAVGISDAEGLFVASVAISDAGVARHVVWAESGTMRSSPIAFDESAWPDQALTLMLRAVASVEGLVIGSDGGPAAGATIAIDPPVSAPMTADARGRFVFTTIATGAYHLEAWSQGAGTRVPLRVMAGRPNQPVLHLRALGRVEGRVLDEAEGAVPGAEVVLLDRNDERVIMRAQTDEEGHFDLGPILPREAALRASKGPASAAVFLGAPYHPIRIILRRRGVVVGQVRAADGSPVRGASVLDHPPFQLSVGGGGIATASGPEARYRLEAVASDVTALHVTPPGQGIYQKIEGLQVVPGEEVVFDLTLEPGGHPLLGQVRDATSGLGIAGVAIELMPVKGGMAFAETTVYLQSDEEGRFEIETTDAKRFLLLATHSRYRDQRGFLSIEAPDFEMTPGRRIFGQVVDEDRVPLTRFEVAGRRVDEALGHFDLAVELAAAEVEFSARGLLPRTLVLPGEGALALGTIVLEAAQPLEVRVLTHDGAPAAGAAIYRYDSGWSSGLQALRESIGGVLQAVAVCDATGNARVFGLREDECLGALLAGHGPSLSPPCARPSEGSFELLLQLAPEAVLEGNAGKAGRSVVVHPEEFATFADERGHYRVGGLGPGPHRVEFRGGVEQGPFFDMRSIDLIAGETARLDLIDPARGSLRVTLRADTDEIIFLKTHAVSEGPSASEPNEASWERARAVTGLHGERQVQFEGLPAGPTRVVASVRDRSAHIDTMVRASETVEVTIVAPKLEP